jgi:hypothetical protein
MNETIRLVVETKRHRYVGTYRAEERENAVQWMNNQFPRATVKEMLPNGQVVALGGEK